MMIVIIVAAVVVVVVALLLWITRTPRQEPGVASFRRHIDALSPESRREVMERVQRRRDSDGPDSP
jgi:flagellar biosynthesis/type III secretory pathway M-ring protein FliF/YscJ